MNVDFLVLILAVVSVTARSKGLRCGPLERIVRDRFGNIYCNACKPCPAGEETTPPCNIDQLYDEDSLINERCKVCDDGYFKEVTERERYNTNRCLRCNTCGNHIVESPCNKTHGEICGKKCKHGYVDSGFGTCISSSKSEPPVKTSNPSVSPKATQKPTTTKRVEEPTKKETHENKEGQRDRKDNSVAPWAIPTIVVLSILCVVESVVCYILWRKIESNPNNGNNNHQNGNCRGIRSWCSSLNCCGIRSCCNRAASGSTAGVEAAGGSVNVPTTSTAGGSVNVPTTSNSTQGRDGQETADSSETQPLLAPPSDEAHF